MRVFWKHMGELGDPTCKDRGAFGVGGLYPNGVVRMIKIWVQGLVFPVREHLEKNVRTSSLREMITYCGQVC